MTKHSLPGAPRESLGLATIMDRETATKWGVPYVHLAVLAIDLDRLAEAYDDQPAFPFGWETVLLADYIAKEFTEEKDRELLEDACRSVMKAGSVLGAQLPFSLRLLVEFADWRLDGLFDNWTSKPEDLLSSAKTMFGDEEVLAALRSRCLEAPLDPPLAPPTLQILSENRVG